MRRIQPSAAALNQTFPGFGSVPLTLECACKLSEHLAKIVESDSVGLGWGLSFCLSNKLPSAEPAVLKSKLGVARGFFLNLGFSILSP